MIWNQAWSFDVVVSSTWLLLHLLWHKQNDLPTLVRPYDPKGQQRSRSCLSLGWHQWYLVTEFCFGDIFTSMKAGIILSLNSFVIYLQELNIDTVYQVIILNLIGSIVNSLFIFFNRFIIRVCIFVASF